MIKVTDYIANFLAEFGVKHIFMVTGGGAMHLNDSFGKHPDIEIICNHHEQACAIAAEGYSRTTGNIAVVNVTTGPGGLNTLTGVMGQWTDSIPVLYISGQVKFETTILSCRDIPLRQLGDQEVNIVEIVKPLTKFAAVLTSPADTLKILQEAIYHATHGRPGPVWIDIPMNVQGALIDENSLLGFDINTISPTITTSEVTVQNSVIEVIQNLSNARRPVLVAGHGIRCASALPEFEQVLTQLPIPVLSTFNGFDLIPSDHPLSIGRIGTIGTRAGNFALQNADLVISIGTRNNIRQISYNWQTYAHAATHIVVDIDHAELSKPTIKADIAINTDVKLFLQELLQHISGLNSANWSDWTSWCQARKNKYPVVLDDYKKNPNRINPYVFIDHLTSILYENAIVVAGNGTACVSLFQAGSIKKGQRMFWNSGCASMGYDLPAALGACIGSDKRDVICLAGDGSLQMNIQELATVIHYKLPLKIFYLNNDGYISIKQTQDNFFEGRRIGTDPTTGVGFPNILKIAEAYGFPIARIERQSDLEILLPELLKIPGPVFCEVMLETDYIFAPKLSSEKKPNGTIISKPLEDMYPFLDRAEFKENMIIPSIDE